MTLRLSASPIIDQSTQRSYAPSLSLMRKRGTLCLPSYIVVDMAQLTDLEPLATPSTLTRTLRDIAQSSLDSLPQALIVGSGGSTMDFPRAPLSSRQGRTLYQIRSVPQIHSRRQRSRIGYVLDRLPSRRLRLNAGLHEVAFKSSRQRHLPRRTEVWPQRVSCPLLLRNQRRRRHQHHPLHRPFLLKAHRAHCPHLSPDHAPSLPSVPHRKPLL